MSPAAISESKKRKATSPEPEPESDFSSSPSPPRHPPPTTTTTVAWPVPTEPWLFDDEWDPSTNDNYCISPSAWTWVWKTATFDAWNHMNLNKKVRELDLKRLELKFRKEQDLFQERKQKWVEDYLNQPGRDQDELKKNLFVERSKWEAEYEKEHFEPFYNKRKEIINGEGYQNPILVSDEEARLHAFWWQVFRGNDILWRQVVHDNDTKAMKYITDIRCHRIEDPRGFKLDFYFAPDKSYFKNPILSKAYEVIGDNSSVVLKAIGTEIEWYDAIHWTRSLTEKHHFIRMHKDETRTKVIEKTESFFNFFETKTYDQGLSLDEEAGELKGPLPMDYVIGCSLLL